MGPLLISPPDEFCDRCSGSPWRSRYRLTRPGTLLREGSPAVSEWNAGFLICGGILEASPLDGKASAV
jgi:hypothetical protein